MIAVAEDPQGVKEIIVFPDYGVDCEPVEGIGCKVFPLMATFKITSNATKPGDTATTKLWLPNLVDGRIRGCPKPCKTKSVYQSVYAEAENFSGLMGESPSVTFTVQH